ncbi:MAG TPA: TetR/AcrR family transcriptional regulator [Polyangiaceae bacterium]|nr:TetR/AcrR family transcriptional regulator [Polyangiaceae bacterium]
MPREKQAENTMGGPIGGLWGKTPASRQRRQEIVRATKAVFLEDGYRLASMERLAAVAGTTKRTLYDHFGSKEGLFTACIEHGCELFVGKLPRAEDLPADITKAVSSFIEQMASLISGPDGVRFQRVVIAEAERHPEFGQLLNEAAFVAAEHVLRKYLERQVTRGKLKPHDIAAWAQTLVGLATNLAHTQALLGMPAGHDTHGARARRQIVAMYVRAHGPEGAD